MEIFQIAINWTDPQGAPREVLFVTPKSRALAEMNAAITNEVSPTMGKGCTIQARSIGNYRDSSGA